MANILADIQKEQIIQKIAEQKNMSYYMAELIYEGVSKLGYEKIKKISKQIHQGKYKNKRKINRPTFERDQVIEGAVKVEQVPESELPRPVNQDDTICSITEVLDEENTNENVIDTKTIDFSKYTNENCGKP